MKHAFVFIFLMILVSCQDIEVLERETINLGTAAIGTDIKSIVVVNKSTTIVANTTTGAKYSIQVYKFGETEPVKTVGFTADSEATIKTINLNELPTGMYDLTLTDIAGTIIKKPLILN
jgi:hypothetical protein